MTCKRPAESDRLSVERGPQFLDRAEVITAVFGYEETGYVSRQTREPVKATPEARNLHAQRR